MLVFQLHFVLDMFVNSSRDAYAAAVSQTFQTRGNVDPVTVNAVFFFHHIPQVDPDAKLHAAIMGQLLVALGKIALDFDCALYRIHHAGKFGQQVVTRSIHHPPPVQQGKIGHGIPVGRQGADGAHLILAHQAAVAFNIRTEDGGKFTFDILGAQFLIPFNN